MPEVSHGITGADIDNGLRPTIQFYSAESIEDWDESVINGRMQLVYVVLREDSNAINTLTGERTKRRQTRTLRINPITGSYDQVIKVDDLEPRIITPTVDGVPMQYIPFTFVGAEDNRSTVDKALLYDLAEINVSHFNNSADVEDTAHISGQPTMFIMDEATGAEGGNDPIVLGSRVGHRLGVDASVQLLQASETSLPLELMDRKEKQMIAMGLRAISESAAVTATEIKIKTATQLSGLSLAVSNVDAAYNKCIKWCCVFLGDKSGEGTVELNTRFFPHEMTPQGADTWMRLVQGGMLPDAEMFEALRQADWVSSDTTDDDLRDRIVESSFGIPAVA
jgi:hypothetical protein